MISFRGVPGSGAGAVSEAGVTVCGR
jgi:hypothetical protein